MKHKDRWDLPKGHVDPGETDLEAAYRELHEETGIQQAEVEYDPSFLFRQQYKVWAKRYTGEPGKRILKTLLIFLGYIPQERTIELTEHPDYHWFEWDPPHQIQKKTIDPLLEHLANHLDSDQAVC